MKGNIQKTSSKEEQQDEQAGAVDQIKKKYGFSSSNVSIYPISTLFKVRNMDETR